MFNLKEFVMKTIRNMVGNLPDYKVQEYSLSWYNRGTITENDLSEIDELIAAQYPLEDTTEELTDDTTNN